MSPRYTCPFVEKFSIEIETYYRPDAGQQTNVFNLSAAEKRQRILDTIDIVRDPISPGEYKPEEDPKLYHSAKTGRGPLGDDWLEAAAGGPLMCAYKLCKVEFRYWGMQSKIEQFIHDVGLRKVMLRAHRQAWCWQDEWTDLTMEDIRQLEEETARMLAQKMAKCGEVEEPPIAGPSPEGRPEPGGPSGQEGAEVQGVADASPDDTFAKQWSTSSRSSYSSQHGGGVSPQSLSEWRMQNIARDSENSSEEEFFDAHEDLSDSDEVFAKEMTKWSSNDFLDTLERPAELDEALGDGAGAVKADGEGLGASGFPEGGSAESAGQACRIHALFLILHSGNILDQGSGEPGSKQADVQTLAATFDAVTRVHFPEALGHVALRLVPCPPICAAAYALVSKLSPYSHDRDSLSSSQDHIPLAALPLLATSSGSYQHAVGAVIARANQAYSTFLHSGEGAGFCGQVVLLGDCVGGILGFDALCQSRTGSGGSRSSSRRGSLVSAGTLPPSGIGEGGKAVCPPGCWGAGSAGVPVAAKPGTRCLSPRRARSPSPPSCVAAGTRWPMGRTEQQDWARPVLNWGHSRPAGSRGTATITAPRAACRPARPRWRQRHRGAAPRRWTGRRAPALASTLRYPASSSLAPRWGWCSRCARPSCPLWMWPSCVLLASRSTTSSTRPTPALLAWSPSWPKPSTPSRRSACPATRSTPWVTAPPPCWRRPCRCTLPCSCPRWMWPPPLPPPAVSGASGGAASRETPPTPASTSEVVKILERWWGPKRIDYSLYCPDALTAFPTITLPHLFHASYWESSDVVAFILRQVMEKEGPQPAESEETSIYSPAIPREKWQRKRTQVKIRNVTANHRASDVIVCEGKAQVLSGRFMYGPLDVVTLTGEKVDIYIMTQPLSGKWLYYGTEVTSGSGRLTFTIPPDKALAIGIYPVRMVVRGDHSYAEAYLTVVARGTESVVFSIDGSFTASVSIMGSDPKVRAGAVDVVRHWQDSGYMIIYVTGRPDMQKHRVVAWLSQHNFPHGAVSFCDGLTHDPLRQKAAFLQSLRTEAEITIVAGYGSTKDVSVYSSLGLAPAHIYIVGRAVKKFHNQCQFLSEGYVAHLAQLEAAALAHSPKGPPRPVLGKGTYGCPAPVDFLRKQSQLLRSRGSSQAERDGGPPPAPPGLPRAKPRSVSLKLEGEE
uniref:DDHD domain-containing protein n=1 Tax=Aquila chrysaetos chrysaetos TaxID=223781 RepID=A0A663F507_AQUCH